MTSVSATAGSVPQEKQSGAISIVLLAIAAFFLVTTEFVIIGFLPALAKDLSVSISTAGLLVTLFAFAVMLFGPFLTALVSHFDRKKLFVMLLLVFAVSNAAAALATNFWIMGAARLAAALALPVFWGTASETAVQLAGPEPEKGSRAIANVYFGIATAMVFGIPIGTLGASVFGWRGTFGGLAVFCVVVALLLLVAMPKIAGTARESLKEQAGILRQPVLIFQLVLSALSFTAAFTAYTYLADLLAQVAKIPTTMVGWWLMGFGVIGMLGNWLGGKMSEQRPLRANLLAMIGMAVGTVILVPLAGSYGTLLIAFAIWGVANTAIYPICQVRVVRSVKKSKALAGSLNVSMANAGIGLGAVVGGAVIDHLGVAAVGYAAAAISVLAVLWAALIAHLFKQP